MLKTRPFLVLALAALVALGLPIVGDVNASTLRTTVTLEVTGLLEETVGLASSSAPSVVRSTITLSNGTGTSQSDVVWSDRRTVAASTTEDLDLAGGGLTDAFGTAFAPAQVKVLVVKASGDNTNDVVVGGDSNSVPFLSSATATQSVKPGGLLVIVAPGTGFTVTPSTGDVLQVANGGAGSTVTYDVLVVGTSS